MPLETNVNGIQDLNPAWPTGVDPVSEGDNHVRNTKDAIQKSFPGMSASWTTSAPISCAALSVNGGMVTDLGVPVNADDAARYGDILARDASIADLDIRVSSNESSIDQNEIDLDTNTANIATNTANIAAIQAFLPFSFSGGSVSSTGTPLGIGSGGYTSSRISTGIYELQFADRAGSAFNHVVVANAIVDSAARDIASIDYLDADTVRVYMTSAATGNPVNREFVFWRVAFTEGL